MKLINFQAYHQEQLKNPKYTKAYHELDEEFALIRQVLNQRLKKKLTQKQLAQKMDTKQSAISRLEAGHANPSVDFLKKLAKALDCKLEIRLVG